MDRTMLRTPHAATLPKQEKLEKREIKLKFSFSPFSRFLLLRI